MNKYKIKQYIPACVTGVKPGFKFIDSKSNIYEIDFIKKWMKKDGVLVFHKFFINGDKLFLECECGFKAVVAIFLNSDGNLIENFNQLKEDIKL